MASYGTMSSWKGAGATPRDAIIPDSEDDDDGYSSSELPSLANLIAGNTKTRREKEMDLLAPAQTAAVGSSPDVQIMDVPPPPIRNSAAAAAAAFATTTTATAGAPESGVVATKGIGEALGDVSLLEVAPPPFLHQLEPQGPPGSAPAKPRARKKQAKEGTETGGSVVAKKPRQRKSKDQAQAQAQDGGALNAEVPKKRGRPRKKAETTSAYFDEPVPVKDGESELVGDHKDTEVEAGAKVKVKRKAKPKEANKEPKPDLDEPLNLEKAVQRKARWTPPPPMPATINPIPQNMQHASSDVVVLSSDTGIEGDSDMFLQLRERFACAEAVPPPPPPPPPMAPIQEPPRKPPRKRKIVETVSTAAPGGEAAAGISTAPDKSRAPKKKARTITITELATKAFRVQEDDDGHEQTMDEDTSAAAPASKTCQAKGPQAKAPRKRKSTAHTKGMAKSKKPPPPPPPILLSPGTALEKASAQAFVFGTSSQLLREDSPGVLRDIQEAMHLSAIEEQNTSSLIEIDSGQCADALALFVNSGAAKPKLWEAGARAEDGTLLQLHVDESVETSFAPKTPITDEATAPFSENPAPRWTDDGDGGVVVVDPDSPASVASFSINDGFDDDPFFASTHPPASSQTRGPTTEPATVPMPNFDSYTDVQLAKEVASFGFKQIKRRSAMIAILAQCWESKNSRIAGGAATCSQKAAEPVAGTARKRGRPRKESVTENDNVNENENETEPTTKPTRGRPRAKGIINEEKEGEPKKGERGKRGRPRKKPDADDEAAKPRRRRSSRASRSSSGSSRSSSSRSPSGSHRALLAGVDVDPAEMSMLPDREDEAFECITNAIISQPRSLDPQKPTWHERILIYDAVILEDLAAWLNLGPLTQAGWDGEVTPADVKKWGEQRGVLCLSREALGGRDGDR